MISFDVISLFTSIPTNVAKNIVEKWPLLKNNTTINKKEFKDLLDLCLDSSYCQYEDQFYLQKNGLPMGSNLVYL